MLENFNKKIILIVFEKSKCEYSLRVFLSDTFSISGRVFLSDTFPFLAKQYIKILYLSPLMVPTQTHYYFFIIYFLSHSLLFNKLLTPLSFFNNFLILHYPTYLLFYLSQLNCLKLCAGQSVTLKKKHGVSISYCFKRSGELSRGRECHSYLNKMSPIAIGLRICSL